MIGVNQAGRLREDGTDLVKPDKAEVNRVLEALGFDGTPEL